MRAPCPSPSTPRLAASPTSLAPPPPLPAGRFFLVERDAWEAGHRELSPSLAVGAFEVSPTYYDLGPNDHFLVSVKFSPESPGPHTARLLFVCDNCQIRELWLNGNACVASVSVESVDLRDGNGSREPLLAPESGALQAYQETVDFEELSVYDERTVTVRMFNATPLPLDFVWNFHPLPLPLVPPTRLRTHPVAPLQGALLPPPGDALTTAFPYSISPASGSLAAGEAAEFDVTFAPTLCELSPGAAILVPVGVPAAAMPGAAALGGPDGAPPSPGAVLQAAETTEVGLRLLGRGVGLDLALEPPALLLPDGAVTGVPVTATVVLTNPNASARSWRWLPEQPDEEGEALHIAVEPSEGDLAGGASVEITITALGDAPGLLRRALLFGVMPHGNERRLPLSLPVRGPDVRLAQRSVDFGLVPFGETRTVSLTFKNHSATAAAWMIAPAPLPRNPIAQAAAAAQAAALGRELEDDADAAKRAMEFGWGWADAAVGGGSAVWARPQRVAAALAAAHAAAGVVLSSAMGIVEAGAEATVQVTIDAAAEQSVRRVLALRVRHSPPSYLPVYAEVVARRACLSTSAVPLGDTYVQVAARRVIKLRNLTRIATDFRWRTEDAEAQQKGLSVRIEPPSGTLAPAEERTVGIEVISQEAGDLNVLVGCELHGGTAQPVGFRLTSAVQGLIVSYEVVLPDDPKLRELAPSLSPHVPPPAAYAPPPPLDFGLSTPCFDQKSLVLIVRNHSAVPTRFAMSAANYPAAVLPPALEVPPAADDFTLSASMLAAIRAAALARRRAEAEEERMRRLDGGGAPAPAKPKPGTADTATSAAGGSSAAGGAGDTKSLSLRRASSGGYDKNLGKSSRSVASSLGTSAAPRPKLSDVHEHSQPFFSESGVTFSAQRLLKEREGALLADGRGAAVEFTPAAGQIRPWGQLVIAVTVHNNLWGLYDDTCTCEVDGLAPAAMALRAGIVGSPITLHDATLGLSNRGAPDGRPQTLSWPIVAAGSAPQQKTIRVLNNGPADARLTWRLVAPADPEKPLSVDLAATADGRVALRLGPAAHRELDDAVAARFQVTPGDRDSVLVKQGRDRTFRVSFDPSAPGRCDACLVAELSHDREVALPGGGATARHPDLPLVLRGETLTPELQLSERLKLKFKVSPVDPPTHPSYTRELTLRNGQVTTLAFTLSVPPPFQLVEARASFPQQALLGLDTVDASALFSLPPSESLVAVIAYVPPKRRSRSAPRSVYDHGSVREGSERGTQLTARSGPPGTASFSKGHGGGDAGTDGEEDRSTLAGTEAGTQITARTMGTQRTGGTSRTDRTDMTQEADADPHLAHRTTASAELKIAFASPAASRRSSCARRSRRRTSRLRRAAPSRRRAPRSTLGGCTSSRRTRGSSSCTTRRRRWRAG